MVNDFIGDKAIPDLVIDILGQNKRFEDVSLYSVENQALYETRYSIMDKVMRDMTREVLNSSINTLVNQFMRQRATKYSRKAIVYDQKAADDLLEDPLESKLDPLSAVAKSIMDSLIKKTLTNMLKEDISDTHERGTLGNQYLIEASFISYFNQ